MLSQYLSAALLIVHLKILLVSSHGNSSLVYVIDDTYSMANDIEQVKIGSVQVLDDVLAAKSSEISNIVLVTFNDPGTRVRAITNDKKVFKDALKSLNVNGGGDCPEYSMAGIIRGLENSLPNSYIYVFTDASAQDFYRVREVTDLCIKKQTQIIFLLTGDCGFPSSQKFTVYYEIAEKCSGQVFVFHKNDVLQFLTTIRATINDPKSVIKTATVHPNFYATPVRFNLDDKTDYAIVSVSGESVDLVVGKDHFGIKPNTEKLMWTKSVKIVKLYNTEPGGYIAWVNGVSDVSVAIYAKTDFKFEHGFSEIVPKSLADASRRPIADKNQHLSILVSDPDHGVRIEQVNILSLKGNILTSIPLKPFGNDFYVTDKFVSPKSSFIIQVRGINKQTGTLIFRNSRTVIEPIEPIPEVVIKEKAPVVSISEGSAIGVKYNDSIVLRCRVSAYPDPTITWYTADGNLLRSNTDVVDPPYDFVSYLKLQNITKSKTYVCQAKNKFKTTSTGIQVNVISPFEVVRNLPAVTIAKYGQRVKLDCFIALNSNLQTSYQWYFRDTGGNVRAVSDRMINFKNATFAIKSMDVDNEGEYFFKIWITNHPDVNKMCTTKVKIDNLEIPVINARFEKIIVPDKDDAKISCRIVKGVPRPTITWEFQKDGITDTILLKESGEELNIKHASLAKSGKYICTAKNVLGSVKGVRELEVTKIPEISVQGESTATVEYGSSHEFICKVVAHPKPTIVWKDQYGNLMNTPQPTSYGYEYTSRLMLSNIISPSRYVCVAQNNVGTKTESVSVTPKTPFIVVTKPEAVTIAKYGQDVNLDCFIAFNSNVQTSSQWYFKDTSGNVNPASERMNNFKNETFTIKSVDTDKEGEYFFKIWMTNHPDVNKMCTTKVKIDNLEIPAINSHSEKIMVQEMDEALLSCRIVKGVPQPTITWEFQKDGKHETILLKESGEELNIKHTSLANSGKYICTAKNVLGSVKGVRELEVTKIPEISIQGESTVTVEYGSSHEFICKVVAHPKPTIVWEDGYGNIINTPQPTSYGYEYTIRLMLSNIISPSQYVCVAQNNVGTKRKSVSVTPKSPFIVATKLEEKTTVQYEKPVKLLCDIKSALPINRVWLSDKTEELIRKGIDVNRIKDNELAINSMDINLQGRYGCKVCLVSHPSVCIEQNTNLEIGDLSPPSITTSQDIANKTFTARCLTKGTPKPTISWYYATSLGEDFYATKVWGEEFKIKNINRKNNGIYKCKAENVIGKREETFNLVVDEPPQITTDKTKYSALVGDKVLELSCSVTGYPDPAIVWKNNENKTIHSDSKYDVKKILNDLYLNIKNPSIKDTSNFICEASNHLGTVTKSFETVVIDNFKNNESFYGVLHKIFILENDSKDIKCDIQHMDSKDVRWYKNGILTDVVGTYFSINKASVSDQGNYTCRVNKVDGSLSETYAVVVGAKPTFNADYESSIMVWAGDDNDFVDCNLKPTTLDESTKVEWTYNGNKTGLNKYEHPVIGWGQYTCKVSNAFGETERSINVTTDGCLIKKKVDMKSNPPLILSFNIGFESGLVMYKVNKYVFLEFGQKMKISCYNPHDKHYFNIHPDQEYLIAECLGEDKFMVKDRVYKYTDIKCEKPVEVTIDNTKEKCTDERSELIKVGFNINAGGFFETYKVCFNNELNVPTFAYSEMSWTNLGNQYDYYKWNNIPNYKGIISTDCDSKSKCCYGKEQLVNAADVGFGPPQVATYYDYNAVGVWKPCENETRISWQSIEENVRNLLQSYYSLEVWSGASGYEQENIGLVPRYLWKVIGYHGVVVYVNNPEPKVTDVKCSSSSAKDGPLASLIKDTDKFTYLCSLDDFSKAFDLPRHNIERFF